MKGGYTTGSYATAGMKAGLLALLDKNIVDQVGHWKSSRSVYWGAY